MSYVASRARVRAGRRKGGTTMGPRGIAAARAALGDVAGQTPAPDSTLATDTQAQLLTTAQSQLAFLQQQEQRERFQKWVQIGVTASIPLFGAIWKVLLGRRRARMSL